VITVLWFLGAGAWVLYQNAKYAPPDLKLINVLLFVLFTWEAIPFVSCFGGLQIASELANFVGYLGLSIALNNGVCRPAGAPVEVRRTSFPFRPLRQPSPALGR
jgi:hypothetical protein